MNLSRRKFTKEFKLAAVRRLEMGASVAEVARACEIDPNLLHRWRREFREGVETAFPGLGRKRASEENRLAELERKIGQQTLEIDFLNKMIDIGKEELGIDLKKKCSTPPFNGTGSTKDSTGTK